MALYLLNWWIFHFIHTYSIMTQGYVSACGKSITLMNFHVFTYVVCVVRSASCRILTEEHKSRVQQRHPQWWTQSHSLTKQKYLTHGWQNIFSLDQLKPAHLDIANDSTPQPYKNSFQYKNFRILPKLHTTAFSSATSETFSITYTSFPASPTSYTLRTTHNSIQQCHLRNIQHNLHLLPCQPHRLHAQDNTKQHSAVPPQ